jgi:hypothetical protein
LHHDGRFDPAMDTLPRFRLPDESSSHDVRRVAGAWEDFDDLDQLQTRVRVKEDERADHGFDAIPTVVRPGFGRKVISRGPLKAVSAANVDDVVEELRAAAAGRNVQVSELESRDLLEEGAEADEVQDVDESELVFDRAVPRRDVWNVQVARTALPRPSIVGPTPAPRSRFFVTAALAMLGGALLAVGVAILVWRFGGISL